MQASSLTRRLRRGLDFRDWAWWELAPKLRCYVGLVVVAAIAVTAVLVVRTEWHASDVEKFVVLLCCGMISMASTPRIMYSHPGVTGDFSSTWILPVAVLLPPAYAGLMAIPIVAILQFYVHPGVFYRRVFSAASLSLGYVAASLCFRLFPVSFAGGHAGLGVHAFTWCLAVGAAEIVGCRLQHFFIVGAVKMTNPSMRIFPGEFSRDALQGLFVEIDLAVLIALSVAISPALVVLALPTVLLVRRFLVHPILVAQSRVDSKTGLLNVSTWEAEAESELSRSVRLRMPVALVLIDIDHFKLVNDGYGHLVGDRVLKAIAEALTGQSRDYDRAGRFGGEEFVLLLAQTGREDARNIAERLRGHIASLAIPVDDRPDAPTLQVTISAGVTAVARGESFELTDLLAAADSAMYAAKQAGRNQVAFAAPLRDMGLNAAWDPARDEAGTQRGGGQGPRPAVGSTPLSGHNVELVRAEHTAASLCLPSSLSVPVSARHEAAMCMATGYARAAGN